MTAGREFGDSDNKKYALLTSPTVDMSVKSSSASNSSNLLEFSCPAPGLSMDIVIAIAAVRTILTLPLCILVLYLGHQRWRQQRSFKTTSHSDIFTYHMVGMNLIWIFALFCSICGLYANLLVLQIVAFFSVFMVFYGEILFHILTCVERYLAVVHPITYMRLRNERGVRIRNISIGCVWLLCLGSMGITALYLPGYPTIPFLSLLVGSLIVVSFCSLSVLRVLIRQGPGEGGGGQERVDRSKQRAFQTITAITGVLWLWIGGCFITSLLSESKPLSPIVRCAVMESAGWFNLPSSLVLPLLFLHRAGKLPCCR